MQDDREDLEREDPEREEEPGACHTWLHIGGPLDGQVKFYGQDQSPPEKVYTTIVVQSPPTPDSPSPANTPLATFDASYSLETIHCGARVLTVYRYKDLTVTEMFTSMLRHYTPGVEGTRSKMLDQMGRGVSDSELHTYVAGGFGIRQMMKHCYDLKKHVQQLTSPGAGPNA